MKNLIKVIGLAMAAIFLFAGSAMALTMTYADNTDSWFGYTPAGYDYIGSPDVHYLQVTINDQTNLLESVVISMRNRLVFDSLFINCDTTGESYENWDYYVYSEGNSGTLYSITSPYAYITASENNYFYRPDHPVAIDVDGLTGVQISVQWVVTGLNNEGLLTYDFSNSGIIMSGNFMIGYTPECANDVILTTPEPSIIMLLGFGLIGLAGFRRKTQK